MSFGGLLWLSFPGIYRREAHRFAVRFVASTHAPRRSPCRRVVVDGGEGAEIGSGDDRESSAVGGVHDGSEATVGQRRRRFIPWALVPLARPTGVTVVGETFGSLVALV